MGIIDPLTNFGAGKNLEYTFKRCRFGHRMSCVPPDRYALRFMDFMREIFVEETKKQRNKKERKPFGR